jgi:hypothetical protein
MVLRNSGRVGSRRFKEASLVYWTGEAFCFFITLVFISPFLTDTNLIIPIKKVNIY